MTKNSEVGPDFDDELQMLVDAALVDGVDNQAPVDLVDLAGVDSAEEPPQEKDASQLLVERTTDLQRLQAEYVNYKRRVDRDRDQARQRGVEIVLIDLLPVLDGIDAARAHDELTGGAAMLADEITKVATKHGLTSYGQPGDPFDPHIHEALMQVNKPGYSITSVAEVFQKGYVISERILRPARVGVAEADPNLVEPTSDQTSASPGDDNPVEAL
jgi:molecular chaperone GrpE